MTSSGRRAPGRTGIFRPPDSVDGELAVLLRVIQQAVQCTQWAVNQLTALAWRQDVQVVSDVVAKIPKALIVDDDPAVVDFLRARFIKMGFEVREASIGLQALVMAWRDRPDVLIVDVNIPDLDGLSLSSTLLGPGNKPLDVIVVSGLSKSETIERCESPWRDLCGRRPRAITSALPWVRSFQI